MMRAASLGKINPWFAPTAVDPLRESDRDPEVVRPAVAAAGATAGLFVPADTHREECQPPPSDKLWQLWIERRTTGGSCYFYLSFSQAQTRGTERPPVSISALSRRRSTLLDPSFLPDWRNFWKSDRSVKTGTDLLGWRKISSRETKEHSEEEITQTNRPTWLCCATTKAVDSSLTQTRTRAVRSRLYFHLKTAAVYICFDFPWWGSNLLIFVTSELKSHIQNL